MNWYKNIFKLADLHYVDIGHGRDECENFIYIFDGEQLKYRKIELYESHNNYYKRYEDFYRGRVEICGNSKIVSIVYPMRRFSPDKIPNRLIELLERNFGKGLVYHKF